MDTVRYMGTEYSIKDVFGHPVSVESFEDILIYNGEYTSREAKNIDSLIAYYVPEDVFNMSDYEIFAYIRKNIDEELPDTAYPCDRCPERKLCEAKANICHDLDDYIRAMAD